MKKKWVAFLLALALSAALCGCGRKNDAPPYDPAAAAEMRDSRYVYLTLWSWQITSDELAEQYAKKAVECGFTAIDFCVLWASFEPVRNHFEWSYLDTVMSVFAAQGLKVSLSPLLWTKDLEWADDLAVQKTSDGDVFAYEGRGENFCLSDSATLGIVTNTLQAFALHASTVYGSYLTRWGVRCSCFGEFDYSTNESLDYSAPAAAAFYDELKEKYGGYSALSDAFGLGISTRDGLEALGLAEVSRVCRTDWLLFRQKTLLSFLDRVTAVFRSADESVPIVLQLGAYGNGMNTSNSGVVDLWTAVQESDVDLVNLSFCDGADPSMMLSLLSSVSTKEIGVEVDGAWALAEGRDLAAQVAVCGKYGVFSLNTANFSLEQLSEYQSALSQYPALFSSDATAGDADATSGILILSSALSVGDPPRSYDALYGADYALLSGDGQKRVRFLTEDQFASAETDLGGLSVLYLGSAGPRIPVTDAFLARLAESSVRLISDSDPAGLSFVRADGSALSEEQTALLQSRLSAAN